MIHHTASETEQREADRGARPRGAIENPFVVDVLQPSRALALGRTPLDAAAYRWIPWFHALHLLAAGGWEPSALRRRHAPVVALTREMDDGRRLRLGRLGFSAADAARLSSPHTRNFAIRRPSPSRPISSCWIVTRAA